MISSDSIRQLLHTVCNVRLNFSAVYWEDRSIRKSSVGVWEQGVVCCIDEGKNLRYSLSWHRNGVFSLFPHLNGDIEGGLAWFCGSNFGPKGTKSSLVPLKSCSLGLEVGSMIMTIRVLDKQYRCKLNFIDLFFKLYWSQDAHSDEFIGW